VSIAIEDELWSAIGDPTRRRMLDLLIIEGIETATALSEQLPVSRQAISKHLQVLDRAGLVRGTVEGRERRYQVDESRLARAVEQMNQVSTAWDKRLDRIREMAEQIQKARNAT
jgi:predicted transcriptional regulator